MSVRTFFAHGVLWARRTLKKLLIWKRTNLILRYLSFGTKFVTFLNYNFQHHSQFTLSIYLLFPFSNWQVRWHPFFLEPSAPKEGVRKLEFYGKKFGARQFERMASRMTEVFCLPVLVCIIINDSHAIHLLVLLNSVRYFGVLEDLNMTLLDWRKFIAYISKI